MTDYTELKRLAEACVAAGEYLPGEAWEESRSYGPDEVAFLEFAPVATPATILALIAGRDQHKAENAAALREATDLALAIWRRRYAKDSPNFQPFEKASNVIGQIDNMAAGLMSDLERLKAENNRLRLDIEAWRLTVNVERASRDTYKSELYRLTGPTFAEELVALRKDAERYRFVSQLAWYVDQAAYIYDIGNAKSPWAGERAPVDADDVEAAIDAAMAAGDQS